MVIRTGCSASAVALHEACLAIHQGNATSAIVVGASILATPIISASMFADEILAPEASCKTFDASTDGYARAEGITAVYIKPLADALRHGNSVRAVIRATSITCDGKGVSLVTPNGDVHEALMRATYSSVGLDPKDTAFIECHATGTLTGDPIETTAVEKVFGEKGIFMTSVKANLGNLKFSPAVSNLLASHENCLFLEIEPHSTLAGPLRQIFSSSSRTFQYTSALSRGKNSTAAYLSAIGELYQQGFSLDLSLLFPSGRAISDFPTYPWDHSASYWFESRTSKAWRFRQYPKDCLLGERTFKGPETEPHWRNHLSTDDVPWLLDHKLQNDVVFPFAGYIAITGEAIRQITHSPRDSGYRLPHAVAHKALVLFDTVEISTSLHQCWTSATHTVGGSRPGAKCI
ncbi:hypothetical protein ACKAV7_013896 [Fusarium commune]